MKKDLSSGNKLLKFSTEMLIILPSKHSRNLGVINEYSSSRIVVQAQVVQMLLITIFRLLWPSDGQHGSQFTAPAVSDI
jgi:hypothetical protein